MPIRRISAALALALVAIPISCSSSDPNPSDSAQKNVQLGGLVGAKCDADSQCTGYAHPSCVTDIKPIAGLVSSTDPKNKPFLDFHVPFPGGYCTNTIDNSCTSDADCGPGAGCFRPFEGVSQMTIDNLNKVGLPFDVNALAKFAVCAKTCQSASDCRTDEGYECTIPLKAFLATINQSYKKTFCFMNVDDQIRGLLGSSDGGP